MAPQKDTRGRGSAEVIAHPHRDRKIKRMGLVATGVAAERDRHR
jgi:hypothetical protein